MKKLMASFATAALLLIMISAQAGDSTRAIATVPASTEITESIEVTALIARVNEINALDKSVLSSTERKVLRKELRAIKRDVNNHGGVIYVSAGVIVLVILLIILL